MNIIIYMTPDVDRETGRQKVIDAVMAELEKKPLYGDHQYQVKVEDVHTLEGTGHVRVTIADKDVSPVGVNAVQAALLSLREQGYEHCLSFRQGGEDVLTLLAA